MAHKEWADRRRTLVYAWTETRFYEEFAPRPELAARVHLPRLALSDSRLEQVPGDCPREQKGVLLYVV